MTESPGFKSLLRARMARLGLNFKGGGTCRGGSCEEHLIGDGGTVKAYACEGRGRRVGT